MARKHTVDSAIEALNKSGRGGLMGYLADIGVAAVGATSATVGIAAPAALLSKTPLGRWLGNAQAPVLIGVGLFSTPFLAMIHPAVGLGLGGGMAALGAYSLLAGPLGLPKMATPEGGPVVKLVGWGHIVSGVSNVDLLASNLGAGPDPLLMGAGTEPTIERGGLQLVNPTVTQMAGLSGPGPRVAGSFQ